MLTLFTNITEELTDLEKQTLVPMLIDTLQTSSEENQLRSKWLVGWFKSCQFDVSDVRIRKMVNYIRVTNAAKPKVLIGSSKGYFLTSCIRTVDDQIESMQGRVDSMAAAIDAMKAQRLNLIHAA